MNAQAQLAIETTPRAPEQHGDKPTDRFDELSWLPCELTLQIPLLRFSVDDLLTLAPGSVLETTFHHSADLPIRVNGKVIGWAELEVVRDRIAVRVTELA